MWPKICLSPILNLQWMVNGPFRHKDVIMLPQEIIALFSPGSKETQEWCRWGQSSDWALENKLTIFICIYIYTCISVWLHPSIHRSSHLMRNIKFLIRTFIFNKISVRPSLIPSRNQTPSFLYLSLGSLTSSFTRHGEARPCLPVGLELPEIRGKTVFTQHSP